MVFIRVRYHGDRDEKGGLTLRRDSAWTIFQVSDP